MTEQRIPIKKNNYCIMTSPGPANDVIPYKYFSELRGVVAIRGLNYLKQYGTISMAEQEERIASFFHGCQDQNLSCQIELLAKGLPPYSDLYEDVQITVTERNAVNNDAITKRKKLKSMFAFNNDYYVGHEIQFLDLEKKNRKAEIRLSGRGILNMAKGIEANYRKALSFCKEKWDPDHLKCLESGTSEEEVVIYVRQKIYEFETEAKKKLPSHLKDDDNEGEDDESSIMKKMSPDYTFKGYMSFMLYGPFVEPSRRLTIFLLLMWIKV